MSVEKFPNIHSGRQEESGKDVNGVQFPAPKSEFIKAFKTCYDVLICSLSAMTTDGCRGKITGHNIK